MEIGSRIVAETSARRKPARLWVPLREPLRPPRLPARVPMDGPGQENSFSTQRTQRFFAEDAEDSSFIAFDSGR